MTPTKTTRLVLIVGALTLATVGCGEADSGSDEPLTTGETSTFVGSFEITDLTVAGSSVSLTGRPILTIDEVAASVAADTGCNTHLGSYSFFDDGDASFTLTGGTRRACDTSTRAQDAAITQVLEDTESWTSSASTITLVTPEGDSIALEPQ